MTKDPRPLSERFDLTYVNRHQWPFNWIKPLAVVLGLAAGLFFAFMSLRDDHRVHSPGPLIHAHQMFEHDCRACHQPDPDRSGYWLPAQDIACLECHIAAAHPDPHAKRFVGDALPVSDYLGKVKMSSDCADCHIEHRGRDRDLNELEDRFCVQCHEDLGEYAGVRWSDDALNDNRVTAFVDDHPEFDVLAEKRVDDTPIKFEHSVHMDPDTAGMQADIHSWVAQLEAEGRPRETIAVALPGTPGGSYTGQLTEGVTLQLTCTACHVPEDDGMYMKPITFAEHCKACHPMGKQHDEPVPHGAESIEFINRLAAQTAVDPPKPKAPPSAGRGGGPGRSGPPSRGGPPSGGGPPSRGGGSDDNGDEPQTIALDELKQKVEDQRESLAKDVMVTAKCMQCHGPVDTPADIVDPEIPDRWMDRGLFGHRAHRFIDCVSCHPKAGSNAELTESYPDDTDAPAWTMHTRDVMLPSIDLCRQCHSNPTQHAEGHQHNTLGEAGAARHDCVMCHIYHGRDEDAVTRHALPAEPASIRAFLRDME